MIHNLKFIIFMTNVSYSLDVATYYDKVKRKAWNLHTFLVKLFFKGKDGYEATPFSLEINITVKGKY